MSLCADIDNPDSFCDLFNVLGDTTGDRHKFFSSPELKAQMTFSDRLSSVRPSVRKLFTFNFLQNHWAKINQTWHKDLWEEGIQVYSNEGPRPFPRGDDYEIHCQNLKILFSRTAGLISTKLG